MKRSDALIGLSHEHYMGLSHVWRIRQGVKNEIERKRITSYILWFFETFLREHFREEEQCIFPMLEAGHPLRLQALAEHDELRSLVKMLNDDLYEPSIALYAHVLEAHIRFEERELFEYLQSHCGRELAEYNAVQAQRPEEAPERWHDEFWVNNQKSVG